MEEVIDREARANQKDAGDRNLALHSITGLRFFAAFFVVLYHYGRPVIADGPRAIQNIAAAGYTAVGLFFVLSGFVLAYSYLGAGKFRGTAASFWVARLARIYPAYLVGFLLSAPFVIAASLKANAPAVASAKISVNAALALTLQQSWTPWTAWYWNTPGWSLSTEVFFYLCFPLLAPIVCRLDRAKSLLTLALLLLISLAAPVALTSMVATAPQPPMQPIQLAVEVVPLFRLPEFLIGVVLGRLYLLSSDRTGKQSWLAPVGAVAFLALLACSPMIPRPLLSNGLLAPATAALIFGLSKGGGLLGRVLAHPAVVKLGEASYSTYILQWPVAHLFGIESGTASALMFAMYALALIAISLLCLRWVESPARKVILQAKAKLQIKDTVQLAQSRSVAQHAG